MAVLAVLTVAFAMAPSAWAAPKYQSLYDFKGGKNGAGPGGGLISDAARNFAGGNDGAIPTAAVVLDAAGNVYGTTEDGGGTSCACPRFSSYRRRRAAGGARPSYIVFRERTDRILLA
jgi:hypothetical protein